VKKSEFQATEVGGLRFAGFGRLNPLINWCVGGCAYKKGSKQGTKIS